MEISIADCGFLSEPDVQRNDRGTDRPIGDGIELDALKPAEDGNGYIVRLVETSGHSGTAHMLSRLLRFDRAWICNATEENHREIGAQSDGLEIAMPSYSIVTVRLLLRRAAP